MYASEPVSVALILTALALLMGASGDHVYVLCTAEDRSFVQLIFGRAGAE